MRQQKLISLLLVVAISLIIFLSTGVGYATVTGNPLTVYDNVASYPENGDFRVGFTGKTSYIGTGRATLKTTGPTSGIMDVTGLSSVGDYVTGIFRIKNTSHDIYAELTEKYTNSNPEFFEVTVSLTDDLLKPRNGEAELRITVELIKTPINTERTQICVEVIANPSYDK